MYSFKEFRCIDGVICTIFTIKNICQTNPDKSKQITMGWPGDFFSGRVLSSGLKSKQHRIDCNM